MQFELSETNLKIGFPVTVFSLWQSAHGTDVCLPKSLNAVSLWLKEIFFQA